MTSKQRSYLKGLSVNLDTIFQIGKMGVTEEICNQLNNALESRELIKIKVLETSPNSLDEIAKAVSSETGADTVCIIGSKIVFYKQSSKEKNRKIDLGNIK